MYDRARKPSCFISYIPADNLAVQHGISGLQAPGDLFSQREESLVHITPARDKLALLVTDVRQSTEAVMLYFIHPGRQPRRPTRHLWPSGSGRSVQPTGGIARTHNPCARQAGTARHGCTTEHGSRHALFHTSRQTTSPSNTASLAFRLRAICSANGRNRSYT